MSTDALPYVHELIDESAVRSQDQDRLGHAVVAAELADLALTAPTPSNIALFGPWGSGKTGIGNLLQENLRNRKTPPRFVRYDAYKYAETPLRRHFLEAIASQLGGNAKKIVRDRYETKSTNKLTLPPRDLGMAAGAFVLALAAYVGISILLTWAAGTGLKDAVSQVRATLPGGVALSAILAIVFSAFGKSLTVQVTRNAPATDDEFESLFVTLVKGVRQERLVVFIDELDRCSPTEVTATLDAIRTFLGVEKCVFIVSADQQVLERALSSGLRQHTPIDTTNPYYTSGSAVLDKLFAQQLHVPPPLPRRLTQYARDLVRDRPGLWRDIDLDRVVSILIPSHVTSPRRIKSLLNNFAVQFRLAGRRVDDGSIEGPIAGRAQELAKLVCLRTEFPLFAGHLADDSQLVSLVVDIHLAGTEGKDAQKPDLVHDATWATAVDFATRQAPVDVLLEGADVVLGTEDAASEEEHDVIERPVVGAAQRSQSAQFLDYLVRTRSVPGPSTDLIHLEHGGTVYGLPNEVTRRLEAAAVNGDVDQVLRLVKEIATSQAGASDVSQNGRERAIRILVQIAQQAAIGIEGDNVARVLLAAVGTSDELNGHMADFTVDCLRGLGFPKITDDASCRHVLRLIAHTSLDDSSLAAQALDFVTTLEQSSDALDAELVRVSGAPAIVHAAEASAALACVLRRSENARTALSELDGPIRAATIRMAGADILANAREDAATSAAVAAPTSAPAAAPTVVPTESDMSEVALSDLVVRFGRDEFIGEMIIDVALQANRKALRDEVFGLLGAGHAVSNARTAALAVEALRRRLVPTWAPVLHGLNEALTQGDGDDTQALCEQLRQSALHVIDKSIDSDQHQENWGESLSELKRLTTSCGPELLPALDARAASHIVGLPSGELGSLQFATTAVRQLFAADMLSGTQAVDELLAAVGANLASLAGTVAIPDAAAWQVWVPEVTSDDLLSRASDTAISGLFTAVPPDGGAGINLPIPLVRKIAIRCAIVTRHRDPKVRLTTPEIISAWIAEGPEAYDDDIRAHVLSLADTAAELWNLIATTPTAAPGSHTLPAITRWIGEHKTEADDLARIALSGAVANEVDINIASAVVGQQVTGDVIAAELIKLFEATDDYMARLRVVRTWQALGVSGDKPTTLLVRQVFIPFVKSGVEAAREGARAIRVLLGASRPAQKEAIDLVRKVTPRIEAEALERALVETGLRKRQRRFFGIPIGTEDDDTM